MGAFQEGASRDSRTNLNRDDKIHGSLLMINELIMNSAWSEEVQSLFFVVVFNTFDVVDYSLDELFFLTLFM